ncbi:MAG: acyl-CoA dehydrogenase family protein [Cellvibrionaceae bacterium]|nr:acyl-CoA dehydrogenase family protein [Cellvibrionaceae bacterium]
MNFDISEEQKMLKDSVARFVQDEYGFDVREKIIASEAGYSADNWQKFAELGWLSIPFAEDFGGFGGGAVDTMVVMEELGRGIVIEPFVATVLMFGGLLAAGELDNKAELIGQIINGSLQGAVAYLEPQSRFELADVKTEALAEGDGYRLSGVKSLVLNGSRANKIIVSARHSGGQYEQAGIGLFMVDADAEGLAKTELKLMDGQRVANLKLDNVAAVPLALEAFGSLESWRRDITLALAAEAVGIMEKLNATTVEYLKTRKQFGVAIGSFQALQHRAVETFMAAEQAKSLLYRAVCSVAEGRDDAAKDIAALKYMVDKSGKLVGGEAIQMHGGMGMTDELDVGHYVKRLLTINAAFGNGDYHLDKLADLSLA